MMRVGGLGTPCSYHFFRAGEIDAVSNKCDEVERYTIDSFYHIANISADSGEKFVKLLLSS